MIIRMNLFFRGVFPERLVVISLLSLLIPKKLMLKKVKFFLTSAEHILGEGCDFFRKGQKSTKNANFLTIFDKGITMCVAMARMKGL